MAQSSYAMFWWIGDGPRRAGRVELGTDGVWLEATTPPASPEWIGFREVARVLLKRGLLHIERRGAGEVRIGSLDTPGALRELADRVSSAARASSPIA